MTEHATQEESPYGVEAEKIVKFKKKNKKMTLTWKYVSPIDVEMINEVEKMYGFTYPTGLKNLILEGNNGGVSPNHFKTGNGATEIKTVLSYNKSDIENVYRAIKTLKADGSNLLPFANTPSGDLICTDGKKIILWSHETSRTEDIANSLKAFIDSLY